MINDKIFKNKGDVKRDDISFYYTLVDCCSNLPYVYPEGHYLAGYPMYILYDGSYNDVSLYDVLNSLSIITSFQDSTGFTIEGCFLLKPAESPTGGNPVNLRNWFDVFYTNTIFTDLCCDCNSSCNSLFFQFPNNRTETAGQLTFSFVGPTGNYNGRNYYQIIINGNAYYVWYSTMDTCWYYTNTLGVLGGGFFQLAIDSLIPAIPGEISSWSTEGEGIMQSYICVAEDPIIPIVVNTYPEERYQLTCCSTGEALIINGLPGIFVFKGIIKNGNHPDDFLEVVLTSIKDINGNLITGCYRVTEAECYDEYQELLWEDVFIETECVSTCSECLPSPVVIPAILNHKTIYPTFTVNNVDADEAERIFCAFGDGMYQKVLALKYGIQFCCPADLQQAQIELEILKMDIALDPDRCCTVAPLPGTCKKYIVTIPSGVEGYLYFRDCDSNHIHVQFSQSSTPFETYVCGITGQTSADIYILANNSTIIPASFIESVDCI